MKRALQSVLFVLLISQLVVSPVPVNGRNDSDHGHGAVDQAPVIEQSGPDEGDNHHPSGKDRSEEKGKSGNQGKSESDPDGASNANGGDNQDKIGYTGGIDKGDQDGNNGCGNDDDFEDDNNGNCRPRNLAVVTTPRPTATPAPTAVPTVIPTVAPTATPIINNTTNNNNRDPRVLGASLPNTGITEVRIGWMMRILGLAMANLALLMPPKKWIMTGEL